MSALTDFLLARIAEEEALWGQLTSIVTRPQYAGLARHILADCDAKRRVVGEAVNYSPELSAGDNGEWAFGTVLRLLALPYADHPDYDEAWRP